MEAKLEFNLKGFTTSFTTKNESVVILFDEIDSLVSSRGVGGLE